jgi:hypothetical protein
MARTHGYEIPPILHNWWLTFHRRTFLPSMELGYPNLHITRMLSDGGWDGLVAPKCAENMPVRPTPLLA